MVVGPPVEDEAVCLGVVRVVAGFELSWEDVEDALNNVVLGLTLVAFVVRDLDERALVSILLESEVEVVSMV